MKAKKISHIGVAVPNIDNYISTFKDVLGLEFSGEEVVKDQKVKVAFLKIGESRIELLEPTQKDSPVGKFLNKNGNKPRFHHIALEVEDVNAALNDVRAAGLELIDETPRRGAGGVDIAFIHPKSTAGMLTEICSPHEEEK